MRNYETRVNAVRDLNFALNARVRVAGLWRLRLGMFFLRLAARLLDASVAINAGGHPVGEVEG